MDIKLVRETVAKIKSQLFKNSNSYAIGMLRSHFKGTGLQFKEHQVYAHGDDVRFIDWKMLAKTSNPYIKTFEEERNIEIAVVIDISPTMLYGYKNVSKLQASIELCCLLFLLAAESGDYVHAILISDEITDLPKRQGELGIISLISALQAKNILNKDGMVNLGYRPKKIDERSLTKAVMKHFYKNREVVILSDFKNVLSQSMIEKIIIRKNVHCFRILSPLDEMDKLPYSVFTEDGKYVKANTDKNIEISKSSKYVKKLNVKDRYLEEFVKEML